MMRHVIEEYEPIEFVGSVFRKGKIGILYGESGIGKTVSTIKALNQDGIKPLLLDFDENDSPEDNECEYFHIQGSNLLKKDGEFTRLDDDLDIPSDRIYVVDTWSAFAAWFSNEKMAMNVLEQIRARNNTVIVIDHHKDIATKQDIPMMDSSLVNHLGFKLYLRKALARESGETVLEIKKLRGYKGSRIIIDWMRNQDLNVLKTGDNDEKKV